MLQGSPPLLLAIYYCLYELLHCWADHWRRRSYFSCLSSNSGWQLILAMSPPAAKLHALLGRITASSHDLAPQAWYDLIPTLHFNSSASCTASSDQLQHDFFIETVSQSELMFSTTAITSVRACVHVCVCVCVCLSLSLSLLHNTPH
jgi:hypothetical protein